LSSMSWGMGGLWSCVGLGLCLAVGRGKGKNAGQQRDVTGDVTCNVTGLAFSPHLAMLCPW
jgi:hypothetical protein